MTQQSIIEAMLMRVRPAVLTHFLKPLFGIKRVETTTREGLRFFVDPVSQFGSTLLKEGNYEPEMAHCFKALLRAEDVFIDVGANEGFFSVYASRLIKNGRVEAIEPQPLLKPVIQKNLDLNGIVGVGVHSLALGAADGHREIYISTSLNSGSSSFFRRSLLYRNKKTVSQLTFDTFLEQQGISRIRLVKIDCEGAETEIIPGMKKTLSTKKIDFMLLEYHPGIIGDERCRELGRLIQASGYQLTRIRSGQWVYHLTELRSELEQLGPLTVVDWP